MFINYAKIVHEKWNVNTSAAVRVLYPHNSYRSRTLSQITRKFARKYHNLQENLRENITICEKITINLREIYEKIVLCEKVQDARIFSRKVRKFSRTCGPTCNYTISIMLGISNRYSEYRLPTTVISSNTLYIFKNNFSSLKF